MIPVNDLKQLEEFLANFAEVNCLLFKHSSTCPISKGAYDELQEFLQGPQGNRLPTALVIVQQAKAVSNEIEQKFGIKHESPQVLLVHQGQVVWHASHYAITAQQISNVVAQLI